MFKYYARACPVSSACRRYILENLIINIFKNGKYLRNNKKDNFVRMVDKRMCPKCKSTDVSLDWEAETSLGLSTLRHFKCNECGFVGTFFPEIDKKQ